MIKGKKIQPKVIIDKPNVNYRKLDALNQSMIKLFDSDPVKFYEEFKLGRKRRDKKNVSLIIGDLVCSRVIKEVVRYLLLQIIYLRKLKIV